MRGILHRIASERPSQPNDVISSVLENLNAVLNSEQGGSPCSPDLGLDLQRLLVRWPSSRYQVLSQIEKVIETYEHRLTNVRVSMLAEDGPNRIAVLIEAELAGSAFCARTELATPGGMSVRRRAIE